MAEGRGVSKNTINRLRQLRNLKPHPSRIIKLSRAAHLLEELINVVGLYLSPPENAPMLCLDDRSRI